MSKRVVVTGMGIASPLGSTIETAFNRLHKFENCIEYDTNLEKYNGLHTRLSAKTKGFVKPEEFTRKVTRSMGEVSLISVVTAKQALEDAGLIDNPVISNGQTGVSYGSCSGSIEPLMDFFEMYVNHELKSLNSGSYIRMMPHTAAGNISLFFKTRGRLIPNSTACTSGSMSIGYAYETIKITKLYFQSRIFQ